MDQGKRTAPSGHLPNWIGLGVLAASVPRDVIDEALAAHWRGVKRRGGKLPPHVMVYFAMAMALYADADYEEIITELSQGLDRLGCWDAAWEVPGSGAITRARQRLGDAVLADVFDAVALPVADLLTPGAFLAGWRLMAVDGFEWDAPDSPANAEAFGYAGGSTNPSAFPKVRVVTLSECGSHAKTGAAIGPVTGSGSGEQTLARTLFPRLEEGQLLLADRNFYSFTDWCQAADTGADLLWRVADTIKLPVLEAFGDGSYLSLVHNAQLRGAARERLLEAARGGKALPPEHARYVRVIEYEMPDRGQETKRELICLLTTVTDPGRAPAPLLAQAYHHRWEHELANKEIKQVLRGPARILRSKSPEMVRQEIYGYLLAHYALSELRCRAATEAGIDPDRIKFTRTLRIVRRSVTDAAAFSP
ncbi:IS4 family transposase [Streptomyces sp. NPDC005356]|uniref:IS4 family transposase n=1 Tax=Streptomyces sp. NPDC005356 TaxID=3157167 RepID=UPI0033ADFA41